MDINTISRNLCTQSWNDKSDMANKYYAAAEAESYVDFFWKESSPFRFLFNNLDCTNIVELACGHGRHVPRYIHLSEKITLVDANESNINVCRERFKDESKIEYLVNNGKDFSAIPSNSASAIFSYDAMVHFELNDIISYLKDAHRILKKNGKLLLHHSNHAALPGKYYSKYPHSRNFNSIEIFSYFALQNNLKVLGQYVFPWGSMQCLDCISLCEKVDIETILEMQHADK